MRARRREKGQSTIEFALTMALLMGFVLFFVHLAFLFAYGNLVHYATFMSARAYLSAGEEPDGQVKRAQTVIIRLLKRSESNPGVEKYQFVAKGVEGEEIPGMYYSPKSPYAPKDPDFSWLQGIRYKFRASLPMVPLSNGNGGANSLTLTSESWLGREKTRVEVNSWMMKLPGGGRILEDNGM